MPDVVIDVRVIPRAKRTELGGERDGAIVVRLAAPPVEGAANDALVAFLADMLRLPRRDIRIVSGEKSRDKKVAVTGMTREALLERLMR